MDIIYVEVKDGTKNKKEFKKCMQDSISKDMNLQHFIVVSNNQKTDDRVSNIEIDGVFFRNWDADAYRDQKALDAEEMELSAKNKNIRQLNDGTYHPSDLMAHKLQKHIEEEGSKSLTMV